VNYFSITQKNLIFSMRYEFCERLKNKRKGGGKFRKNWGSKPQQQFNIELLKAFIKRR